MATLNIDVSMSADTINQMIRDASTAEPLVVRLAAGTYNLAAPIRIERNDVTLVGAGTDKTILRVAAKDGGNAQALVVSGDEATPFTTLTADTTALKKGDNPLTDGTHILKLDNVAGLTAGSIIRIDQENDDAYLKASGNDHLIGKIKDGQDLRRMIAEVVKVEGNEVTIKSGTPYAFENGKAKVSLVDGKSLEGIEISDFSVTSDFSGKPDKYLFKNVKDGNDDFTSPGSNSAIEISNVVGLKMNDVNAKNVVSTAFEFSSIFDATIDSLKAEGAWNKGDEGNGYAFLLKTAFNNTLTNLEDRDMRHSVITGSFTPEHFNDIKVLFTNRDINFHGSPDSFNKIEVVKAILDFEDGLKDHVKPAVSAGNKDKHPNATVGVNATIDWNDVTFKYLDAGNAMNIVHGDDSGSFMLGGSDIDRLYGGKGKDYLSGGGHKDVLTGGGSQDIFVFSRKFGQDEITDFQNGKSGDTLDLKGTGITGAGMLSVRHTKSDTIVGLGGGDTLTLEDVSKAEWGKVNVKYDASKLKKGVTLEAIGSDFGFSGTKLADTFVLKGGNLKDKPNLFGGAGVDTLKLSGTAIFDATELGRTSGIETVDMSGASRKGRATIDKDFVKQADKDYVIVKVGSKGLALKTEGLSDWDDVRVSGKGQVELSSSGVALSAAGSGAINVLGGSGIDKIKGGSGKDTLNGGKNKDVLEGGKGDDSFVFSTELFSSNVDNIADFSSKKGNNDTFRLDKDVFKDLSGGKTLDKDDFAVVTKGSAKADNADARIVYEKSKGNLYYDAEGSGSLKKFAHLDDNPSLGNADFLLI